MKVWKCPGEFFGQSHMFVAETMDCPDHPGQIVESVTADEAQAYLIERIVALETKVRNLEMGAPQGVPRLDLPPLPPSLGGSEYRPYQPPSESYTPSADEDDEPGLWDRFVNWWNEPINR